MSELNVKMDKKHTETVDPKKSAKSKARTKLKWETPKMEDVSEQVMAQPYIRFT